MRAARRAHRNNFFKQQAKYGSYSHQALGISSSSGNAKFEKPPRANRRMAEDPTLSLSSKSLLSELISSFRRHFEGNAQCHVGWDF